MAPFPVVAAEEILTSEGEIIGLFLSEEIPRGLSPEETVARIRAQGGVVYIPHPFDRFRGSRLSPAALARIVGEVDVLEVWNGRTLLPTDNLRAAAYAARHRLLRAAASDAHTTGEVGQSHVIVRPFSDAPSFLAAMADAQLVERVARPWVHLASRWQKLRMRRSAQQGRS
jgi:predicted metal-dependent phosphoesterase TrpH